MKFNNYYLIVFESKNHAVLLYTLLESKGNNVCQLVSTPCALKAGCTYSIRVPHRSYFSMIKSETEEVKLGNYKIYYVDKVNGKTTYKEVDLD